MKVVNKRTYAPQPGDRVHYVGRPSVLGNRWSHRDGTLAEFKTSSREESIQCFELWLRKQVDAGDPVIIEALLAIQEGDILQCWCAPAACHSEVIVKVVRQLRAELEQR